ncbi:MAG: UbiA prenyltransferase family protein [Cyclobacteriaceae bacterium]|nr:UbiA prenyltransferase family protein [Cyclobacteriaceae bacterium HetDA_MAG_MS6]
MKVDWIQVIKLLRPNHYVKNLFVFTPIFFGGEITNVELLMNSLTAFVSFSLIASSIYILNDYKDVESDKKHPEKANRPLASRAVNHRFALVLMVLLVLASFSIAFSISINSLVIVGFYFVLNIAYSLGLKRIAIVDVTIIALGFIMRLLIGAVASTISLSLWIIIMTFLLALFLGFAKRRDDVLIYLKTGKKMRASIDGYNLEFVSSVLNVLSGVIIVSYILYTTNAELPSSEYLYATSFFVILGILRYLQISLVEEKSGSPTSVLLKDNFIRICLLGWVILFYFIIYIQL